MALATAMPAMVRSWDVCIDTSTDLNASTEAPITNVPMFFSAVANIYPKGTFHQSAMASPQLNCTTNVALVGTFFAKGALVANLRQQSQKHSQMYFTSTGSSASMAKGSLARAVWLSQEIPASPIIRYSQAGSVGWHRRPGAQKW